MDIKTLESLGINIEDLKENIIDQAVHAVLYGVHYQGGDSEEAVLSAGIKREIEKRVQAATDAKISAIAEEHIIPRIGEMIESANMQATTRFGEPTGPKLTFKEYIAIRAREYMSEDVDYNAHSKAETNNDYNWRKEGPRLTVLMRVYIRETLEKATRDAVNNVNKAIAEGIQRVAKEAIEKAAKELTVTVKA